MNLEFNARMRIDVDLKLVEWRHFETSQCKHNALPPGRYVAALILMVRRENAMECEPAVRV
jgi:hypothetical protein